VRERILQPLGMTATGIALTPAMKRHFALVHDERGEVVPVWDIPTLAGAGALRSSITDMLRFAAATLGDENGHLERALAGARAPRHRIDAQLRIGLNWHILRSRGRDIVWHNGGTAGSSSFIGLDGAKRTAVVVLSNSVSSIDDIGMHFLDERLPLAPPDPRQEAALAPRVLERYVGVYALAPNVKLTVTRSPKGLSVEVTGQGRAPIYARTETEFFLKAVEANITFTLDSRGAATGLVLHQGGVDTPARRISAR